MRKFTGMRKLNYLFIAIAVLVFSLSLASAEDEKIEADNFWVREVPPVSSVTAAFGMLRSKQETELVSVTSSIAQTVELHTNVSSDGAMHMRKVASISLSSDTPLELSPGGYHIMFIDLKKPLKKGDMVDITLTFSSGYSLLVHAPVRSSSAAHTEMKHK